MKKGGKGESESSRVHRELPVYLYLVPVVQFSPSFVTVTVIRSWSRIKSRQDLTESIGSHIRMCHTHKAEGRVSSDRKYNLEARRKKL